MKVLLLGDRGAGKTTCCEKTISLLKERGGRCYGFLTHRTEDGFMISDIESAKSTELAGAVEGEGERIGKYLFFNSGIEFGIKAMKKKGDLCFIDELGALELGGKGFFRALSLIREKNDVIITCRDRFYVEMQEMLGMDLHECRISMDNRDAMPETLCAKYLCEKGSFCYGDSRDKD